MYVRGGSILPLQPLIQSTDETPNGPLELRVYPGQPCSGSLYLDDGHTFRYQRGEFLRQTFTCQSDGNSVRVNFGARQGTLFTVVENHGGCDLRLAFSSSRCQALERESPLKTSYDAPPTLSTS